ncbi:MAG TPA: hypothetical protein VHU41_15915, partial [Thermoanaerobaculia bacterium]|nr:hypothetical protein [Thermoanaerobaculia bacterium]
GYGYGSGDGSGYWLRVYRDFVANCDEATRRRLEAAERDAAVVAFWRSDEHGQSANGGRPVEAAAPGVVHEIQTGELRLCSAQALHATMDPAQWQGSRLWVVALYGEVKSEADKFGALRREIIAEIPMGRAA